ncbi:endothelin-converting enzyme 1-like [Ixodes scapularis]|uniref:endothelin-converting enzyme 1-like n=1 Tax=Ixodes scapularis TaxID=6945 RepID=UPI001C381801|nr:endothelin-converting enzyme 1-like [Ixodes scapularis]
MAEEIRETFIEKSETMKGLDPWTKNNVRLNAQNVGVFSFFAPQFSTKGAVEEFANQVNSAVPWKNKSLDYFLGISKFVAAGWMEPMRTLLPGERNTRRRYSVFDTSCHFSAQKNAVLIPEGLFNRSIPTSTKERMFHVPRVGPRLAACLFQAVFEENFYHPYERLWTIASNEAFKQIPSCLSKQYGIKRKSWMLGEIEANAGLAVAYQVFQDRLFTKRYLQKDYRLQGCDRLSSNQLFFVYFAMSYCEHSTHKKSDSMRNFFENRVNVPVMNSKEFADAFSCQPGSPMNPTTKCTVLM